ncbi:glycerophosphodiester phosphodiesterase [Paenibacillus sp. PL91]|uniref:glycerophosphodiester phosphodiesterase n=1 Tax=Paenibacillus sp. PL91 TaxID=2729538 RepID=UPI00145C8C60|nr:glycerophosphodiester phosphodiesterase family protein [Paenibacillus sp. PL91]MBC9201618.1 glycerophosphodiester phosphodiesterase [Paenibacillus sp. PL91]
MERRKPAYIWRRIGLLLLALCCATLFVSASNPNTPEGFLIFAHRGASGYAPENTMAAFEEAEKLGSDFIEFDVQLSKDEELVVIHDDTVDRTTEHSGSVDEYTLNELEGMKAGSEASADDADEKILSFHDVMDRFAGKIGMLIEIKDSKLFPGIEEKVADVVRRYELRLNHTEFDGKGRIKGMGKVKNSAGIIIQSYDFDSTRRIHDLLPDIPVAALIHEDQHPLSNETLDELTSYAAYINYTHELLDEKIVQAIHDRNRKVIAWTIQNDGDMERMKKLGVDGVITDYPG